jgi:putative ABC transport system permease protein
VAAGGRTYGQSTFGQSASVQELISEDYYRAKLSHFNDAEAVDFQVERSEKSADGRIADHAQLYGMEDFALGKLRVLEGDISKLTDSTEPGASFIAAVYHEDDYGNCEPDSHWAKLGEKLTLRYVEEWEYYSPNTGEIFGDAPPETEAYRERAKRYRDVEYEVAALITVPHNLSYRYYGSDQFVLGAETFKRDGGGDSVMYYAFDTQDDSADAMEAFMADFTGNLQPQYNYESKQTYMEEFNSFRNMFLTLGGVLCFIIGLVGALNFLGSILTGIITRRREFAMLTAIGMTGKQLKAMLIWEGLYNTLGAVLISLLLCAATGPMLGSVMGNMFWFFSYRFSVIPVLAVAPLFAVLGVLVPLVSYHFSKTRSVVERLRIE